MNGFFARMGERAAGRQAPLRVRAPQRFEPALRWGPPRVTDSGGPAVDPWAPDLDVETVVDAVRAVLPEATTVATPRDRHRDLRTAAAAGQDSSSGEVADPVLRSPTSRQTLREETPQDRPPAPPLRPPAAVTGPHEPSPRVEDPLPAVPPPPAETRRIPSEEPRAAELSLPRRESSGAVGPPAVRVVEVPAVEVPDVGDLVRRHVLPALVARGLAGPHETVEVVTDATAGGPAGAPARRGSTTLTVTPARYSTAGGQTGQAPVRHRGRPASPAASPSPPAMIGRPEPPQVHVHIDRVVVARPAPPPRPAPAAPVPRSRPQPDHEAYLARRREGR